VAAGAQRESWFDLTTLKEPYRIEGKKTMAMSWRADELGIAGCDFYPPAAA